MEKANHLQKMNVLITGATGGLGLELASRFSSKEFNLTISGRDNPKLNKVKKMLGDEVFAIKADVRKISDCQNLINKASKKFGAIDILVNNAGIWSEKWDPSTVNAIFDTNVKGLEYCSYYAFKNSEKTKNHLTLVNISSSHGIRFNADNPAYSSSKFAVVGFSGSLYFMHKNHMDVICFCPGGIKTELFRNNLSKIPDNYMNPSKVSSILFDIIRDKKSGIYDLSRKDRTLSFLTFETPHKVEWVKKVKVD